MQTNYSLLRNQLNVVRDIIDAMQRNYTKSTYNMESGLKRFVDAIEELMVLTNFAIKALNTDNNYKAFNSMLKMIQTQIPQLLDETTKESTINTLHQIIMDMGAPEFYRRYTTFCQELLENHDDLFQIYDQSIQQEATQIINLGINVTQEILNQDKPANILIPKYHFFASQFLNTIFPQMFKNMSEENVKLYAATTVASDIGYKDRERFSGVAVGNFDSFMATNNAFDLIFDIPDILARETSNNTDYSVFLLKRYWNYLKEDGIAVITLPSFALIKELRLYLHNHFILKGLRKYTTSNSSVGYEPITFYTLVLQKAFKFKIDDALSDIQYKILTDLALERIQDIKFDQQLPYLQYKTLSPVKLFKGPEPDTALLMSILVDSPLYKLPEEKPKQQLHPLLPFERGQIGLVLASGCLDGIIDEGNGYKHVIRGRVFQSTTHKKEIVEEHENNREGKIELTSTVNNLTEINVMTGNGIYKSIMVPIAM